MTADAAISRADTSASPAIDDAAAHEVSALAAIERAVARFGRDLTLLCSGQDAVLVDLAMTVDPTIEVTFIDTGFHFNETIETMLRIAERYRPSLRVVVPWKHLRGVGKPGFCCSDHKVEQLDHALHGRKAWISGLRRADAPSRADAAEIETDRRGLAKINPIVAWSDEQVAEFVQRRAIIVNPLRAQGYPSIGCKPCTSPLEGDVADLRAGRWAGTDRSECGIHG